MLGAVHEAMRTMRRWSGGLRGGAGILALALVLFVLQGVSHTHAVHQGDGASLAAGSGQDVAPARHCAACILSHTPVQAPAPGAAPAAPALQGRHLPPVLPEGPDLAIPREGSPRAPPPSALLAA